MSDVVLALVVSCVLVSLPVLAAMVVVKHAGVNLSGPRYTALDDHMLYVRWDEGHLAALVTATRGWSQRPGAISPQWAAVDDRSLVAVYDLGSDDIPYPEYGK